MRQMRHRRQRRRKRQRRHSRWNDGGSGGDAGLRQHSLTVDYTTAVIRDGALWLSSAHLPRPWAGVPSVLVGGVCSVGGSRDDSAGSCQRHVGGGGGEDDIGQCGGVVGGGGCTQERAWK